MPCNSTLPLPVLPGYMFRMAERADLKAIHAMLMRIAEVDHTGFVVPLEDMHNQFEDPWCDPKKDYLLALTNSGQVAATGRIYLNPASQREPHANLGLDVHPEQRGCGLENTILNWMEGRARQKLLDYPADLPRSIRVNSHDTLSDRIALFESHGFSQVRAWHRMRRDLSQPIPATLAPPGLKLSAFRAELGQPLMEAFNETFYDHWGFEPISEQDWQMFFIQSTSFRPDLSFLALDGPDDNVQIAAFCLNFVWLENNQREGIAEGIIAELGTRRPWRKRGIATALLCASMHTFKANELCYAGLEVDVESPTGAQHLYKQLGFTVIKRTLTFSKPVG